MTKANKQLIVPDIAGFVREVTEYGNIGAIVRRVLRLPIAKLITLAWWNKWKALRLLKKDFGAGMVLLTQIELLTQGGGYPPVIWLTEQVVDLSVATKNIALLLDLCGAIRTVGATPGLRTNNLQYLVPLVANARMGKVMISEGNSSANELAAQYRTLIPKELYYVSRA